ncbi:MAG: endonuclease/exonuclease/phosphatase family protein [Pseudomonadota bacterium]
MPAAAEDAARLPPPAQGALRLAVYNAALSRDGAGRLLQDIRDRDPQVLAAARVILTVRPDILVLCELDRDGEGAALAAFSALLAEGFPGLEGLDYAYRVQPPSNTGVPSGHDLDGDGTVRGPGDAHGYGLFPGHYALAVLSRLPIETQELRTWARLRWSSMPGALRPVGPEGKALHDDAAWAAHRLSSKTHLAVPVRLPGGGRLTVLAAHPTPPVFDGPADRNGRRNHDEVRLIAEILDGAPWLVDYAGRRGGIAPDVPVLVAGDLNADPADGDARRGALARLLAHPRLQDPRPTSEGARVAAASGGGANLRHVGPAATDTADWRDMPGPGNLRVDYVLPPAAWTVTDSGVFWPAPGEPGAALVAVMRGGLHAASDHRLVWVDAIPPP